MKRLAVVVLASLVISNSVAPASAELLKNFHLGGQIDVQATSGSNITDFATPQNYNAGYPPGGGGPLSNNDRVGDVQTRVMIHLDWDLLDDVHSKITLRKNDRTWGTAGGAPVPSAATTNSQPINGGGGADVLDTIFVDQAYFKVDKIAGQLDLTMGRQFYGDANDIVIYYGPSEKAWYGLPVSAVDAARADWQAGEWLNVTGLAGKITGSGLGVAGANVDLRGINFAARAGENFKGSLYLWNKLTHNAGALGTPPTTNPAAAGGKNDNLYVVGAHLKASGGGFWVKGEFDQDFGDNRINAGSTGYLEDAAHYAGWATMGDAGFKAESDNVGMFSLWGQIALGSGRQNTKENSNDGWVAINSDYRPGTIYGRFQAIPGQAGLLGSGLGASVSGIGGYGPVGGAGQTPANDTGFLSNRFIWGAGIKMSPAVANKFQLALSWWDFHIHRFDMMPQVANNIADPYTSVNARYGQRSFLGNNHLGDEFDVDVTWTHSENVAFATGWATFQPGGLINEAVAYANRLAAASNNPGPGSPTQGVNPAQLAYFDVRIKF